MGQLSYLMNIPADEQDLHIALLYAEGVESFIQSEDHMEAFVDEKLSDLQQQIELYCLENNIPFSKKSHEVKDWNAVWESQFEALPIGKQLLVRATFHDPDPEFEYDLIIAPKMAFGTGHHETTSMILEYMTGIELHQKDVLDFGCGTGILGIFALLKGAGEVVFIDNDPLAIENTAENLTLNHLKCALLKLGGLDEVPDRKFDYILANITRNVLTECLPKLSSLLNPGGNIALSGFLASDKIEMEKLILENQLKLKFAIQKGEWICLIAET
ncbi:MAG: 50S ribosomal protein L11 methyltransferase [Saprospiraceae bacterium]|nr:50S ribosomal protein L11 methyltransferase [Saprospiraceae bacterium]